MTFFEAADKLHEEHPELKTIVFDFYRDTKEYRAECNLSEDKYILLGFNSEHLLWSDSKFVPIAEFVDKMIEDSEISLYVYCDIDTSSLYDKDGNPIYLNGIMKYT